MNKVFDFHFHLLFKHYVTGKTATKEMQNNVLIEGRAKILDDLMGGAFGSQASPKQLAQSPVYLGVINILALEHAFAERILTFTFFNKDVSFREILPLDWNYVEAIKQGTVTYYDDLQKQIALHLEASPWLGSAAFNINFLNRKDWRGKNADQIATQLEAGDKRYFALALEGGHNLSDVKIAGGVPSRFPELKLKALQDRADVDIMSMNLCHLSFIPEQILGGFCQGLNKLAQIAFKSDNFWPKPSLGITELGKKVIRQALTHATKPVLIDVKHMSVYTRFHYYRFREKLMVENNAVARLPIITSHTGFTFTPLSKFIQDKQFRSHTEVLNGLPHTSIQSKNTRIGRTDDTLNSGLFANPWTINLFDEEITEIMNSNGMIGISMDQRVLGVANMAIDSVRPEYYEEEYIAQPEFERLFERGEMPTAEKLVTALHPTAEERHVMLVCLHIIHAVRIGYATLAWTGDKSPWDHLCVGSDFDGLINPINAMDNATQFDNLRTQLIRYLPQAEKSLVFNTNMPVLKRTEAGTVDADFLNDVVDKFMYQNGRRFIARFLSNWGLASESRVATESYPVITNMVVPLHQEKTTAPSATRKIKKGPAKGRKPSTSKA